MTPTLETAPLIDDALYEAIAFLRSANPFCEYTWGWETGRFIDFRWGGNTLRETANPGFFERHGTVVRRGSDVVALIVAEYGGDDHCVLTREEDPDTLDFAVQHLIERRRGKRMVLAPSDEAAWVHEVIRRHGFVRGDVAELGWGYHLDDVPEPIEPEGFNVRAVSGAADYAGIDRCLKGAFGGDRDASPVLESLAAGPAFRPELSIVAEAANGDIAAYCRGTVDPDGGVGSIDPVATHPDYQRRGLGRAIVLRCFAEQRRLGGTMSFIGSGPEGSAGSRLYRALNPASITSYSEWSRPA